MRYTSGGWDPCWRESWKWNPKKPLPVASLAFPPHSRGGAEEQSGRNNRAILSPRNYSRLNQKTPVPLVLQGRRPSRVRNKHLVSILCLPVAYVPDSVQCSFPVRDWLCLWIQPIRSPSACSEYISWGFLRRGCKRRGNAARCQWASSMDEPWSGVLLPTHPAGRTDLSRRGPSCWQKSSPVCSSSGTPPSACGSVLPPPLPRPRR